MALAYRGRQEGGAVRGAVDQGWGLHPLASDVGEWVMDADEAVDMLPDHLLLARWSQGQTR